MMNPDDSNNLIATGALFQFMRAADLDPAVDTYDGTATNSLTVKLPFMQSRYRITVDRVLDEDDG